MATGVLRGAGVVVKKLLSVGFFAGGSPASAATARGRGRTRPASGSAARALIFFWISFWAAGGLPNKSEAARVT